MLDPSLQQTRHCHDVALAAPVIINQTVGFGQWIELRQSRFGPFVLQELLIHQGLQKELSSFLAVLQRKAPVLQNGGPEEHQQRIVGRQVFETPGGLLQHPEPAAFQPRPVFYVIQGEICAASPQDAALAHGQDAIVLPAVHRIIDMNQAQVLLVL